ncbi:hypothetical protein DKT77_18425 [Meridianimarinicoccus roseus]|uniref:histidine kinase n=1 Tax=Meridianimarinicoccus roseus TaxID=2072018 RepID=A0A2V2LD20_9RHOB|nr:PAS domain-containing protein [Meridianimarinicoccus roseus]PWR01137.1 hypothetical protein DKT77_18425 [Meridianimarinicoccus roseus]
MTDTDGRDLRRHPVPDRAVAFAAIITLDGTVRRIDHAAGPGADGVSVGQSLWQVACWGGGTEGARDRVEAMIRRAVAGASVTATARVAPGGEAAPLEVLHRIVPVRGQDGAITGLVATATDVGPAAEIPRSGSTPGSAPEPPDRAATFDSFAQFESIYAGAETGIALHDARLRLLRANDTWSVMGTDPLKALIAGRRAVPTGPDAGGNAAVLATGTDPRIVAAIRRVLSTGQPLHGLDVAAATGPLIGDLYPVRPDGPKGRVRAVATCLRRPSGARPADGGDAAVRANLERLLEGMPSPATLHEGRSHRFVYANAAARRILDGQSVLGRTLADVLSGYDVPGTVPRFDAVFQEGAQDVVAEFEMPPGSARFYYNALLPWHHSDGSVGGVLSYAHEITPSVRARRDATEARDRLRRMLDATGAMMVVLDHDGSVLEANSALLSSVGAARRDVLNKPIWTCPWWCDPPETAEDTASVAIPVAQRLRAAVARAAGGVAERFDARMACHPAGLREIEVDIRPLAAWDAREGAMVLTAVDVTERQRAIGQTRFLLDEINHRSKNMLGVVQSIARQMGRYEFDDFADAFGARLQSLAAAQDLLIRGDSGPVTLNDLARAQLGHLSHLFGTQIILGGPKDVRLSPQATQSLSIALHELATNAEKHGALARPLGQVHVSWGLDGSQFWLDWRESGGPPVAPPVRRGFGRFVLERVASRNLDAEVSIDWAPTGVHWRLETNRRSTLVPPRHSPSTCVSGGGAVPTILIAEDEPLLGYEMAERLREVGHAICGPARTVADAMALLDSLPCAACVMDLDLAGERADALAERLIEQGIPCVRVSAHPADAWPGFMGASPFIAKPVDFRRLVAVIAGLTGGAAARRKPPA